MKLDSHVGAVLALENTQIFTAAVLQVRFLSRKRTGVGKSARGAQYCALSV
jgi:hypothetical protein